MRERSNSKAPFRANRTAPSSWWPAAPPRASASGPLRAVRLALTAAVVSWAMLATAAGAPPALPAPPAPSARAARPAARGRASLPADSLDVVRREIEALLQAQALSAWTTWTTGRDSRQAAMYAQHLHLFDAGALVAARAAERRAREPRARKALTWLRRYLESGSVARQLAPLDDSLANLELHATVAMDSAGRVPWRRLEAQLAAEPRPDRRQRLYAAGDSLLDALRPIETSRLELARREAARLGYASLYDFYQEMEGIPFRALEKEARAFLEETQGVYDTVLSGMALVQLGMKREDLRGSDLPRLIRLANFDEYFTPDQLLAALTESWKALGVDPARQDGVHLDAAARGDKDPRPACFPVRVPGDVRVCVLPRGGLADYEGLFRETGRAEARAFTRQARMEFRRLGPDAVGECTGFLEQYLLQDPAWLDSHREVERYDLRDYISQAAFVRLFETRRCAGRFLYEMDLHRGHVRPEDAYGSDMRAAMLYPVDAHDARRCYQDEQGFREAGELEGRFLEPLLRARLRRDFGPRYFEDPRSGRYLESLWATGRELSGAELARRLGAGSVDHRPLAQELRRLIQGALEPAPPQSEGDQD